MGLAKEKLAELDLLYKVCTTIWRYLRRNNSSDPIAKDHTKHLEEVYKKKDTTALKGFRICLNDLGEYLSALSLLERKELNKVLQDEVGVSLEDIEHKRLRKIEKIVQRGKVKNPDEYRLILGRIEEIYDNNVQRGQVDILSDLLHRYDKPHKPKNE